jgi:hypothetical protein
MIGLPTSGSRLVILGLFFGALWLSPVPSRAAAPQISSFEVVSNPITPYNSGDVQFLGNISNIASDTKITVRATDGVAAFQPVHKTFFTWYDDDPGTGRTKGDFAGTINITDLGTHDGSVSNIDVFVTAASNTGETSTLSVRVSKQSADFLDVYPPTKPYLAVRGPPPQWCHISTSRSGSCIPLFDARHPFLPSCRIPSIAAGPLETPEIQFSPGPLGLPCQVPLSNGHGQWSGNVDDAGPEWVASEIKDVVLTITDAAGNVVKDLHSFLRVGTKAYFNVSVAITEFNPGEYKWRLTAIDALDHVSPEVSGQFTVAPDGCPNPPVC